MFWVSVISCPVAVTLSVPASVSTPVCVTAPVAVRSALPTVNVPSVVAPALVVSFDPVTLPDTVRALPVAVSVVSPVVVNTAVVSKVFVNCVTLPVRFTCPVSAFDAFVSVMSCNGATMDAVPPTVRASV